MHYYDSSLARVARAGGAPSLAALRRADLRRRLRVAASVHSRRPSPDVPLPAAASAGTQENEKEEIEVKVPIKEIKKSETQT